jgi:hypothetical protein
LSVRALLVQPTFTHAAALVKVGSLLPFAAFAHEINAKSNIERLQCGQTGLMHVRLLLTQHFLAVAAMFMLRCSLRRGSGRSKLQSRWISNRPFAASCSSSHIARQSDLWIILKRCLLSPGCCCRKTHHGRKLDFSRERDGRGFFSGNVHAVDVKTGFVLLRRKSARSSHSYEGSAFNWVHEPSHLDN